jgi:hypothetical protein
MKSIPKAPHINSTLQIIQPMLDVKFPIEGVVSCIRTYPNNKPGNVIIEVGAIVFHEE